MWAPTTEAPAEEGSPGALANRVASVLRGDLGATARLEPLGTGRAIRLFDWLRHDGVDYSGDRVMVAVEVATGLPVAYRASWSPSEHRPFTVPRSAALDSALRHAQATLEQTGVALTGERCYLTYPGSQPPHPTYAFYFRTTDSAHAAVWVIVDGLSGRILESEDLARLVQ